MDAFRSAHSLAAQIVSTTQASRLYQIEVQAVASERDRWLKFFKEGEYLDSGCLPGWMHTAEIEQAMTVMNRFSEKEAERQAKEAQRREKEVALAQREERRLGLKEGPGSQDKIP